MSYGIILYNRNFGQPLYLLGQRRDTYEYATIILGTIKTESIPEYSKHVTPEERERIKKYSFDELWKDVFIWAPGAYTEAIRAYKTKAQTRFEEIKPLVMAEFEKNPAIIFEPIWCFPKGKKNTASETDLDCAFREFIEETRMEIDYNNLMQFLPCTEVYTGTDNITYGTVYYIARTDSYQLPKAYKTTGSIRQWTISDEMAAVKWCTFDEALDLLEPEKQGVLKKAHKMITSQVIQKLLE